MIPTSDIISSVAVLVNIALVSIAYFQLKGLRKIDSFRVIIDLDRQIPEQKAALDSITIEFQVLAESKKLDSKNRLRFKLEKQIALENYINCLERLAFLILKKYLPRGQAKDQYRILVCDIVDNWPEQFGPTSHYTSLKKLYAKWK